jgi:hypothetical protein
MSVAITEHDTPVSLTAFLERVGRDSENWGACVIRRDYLKPLTNEAFLFAIDSIVQLTQETHIYFS